MAARATDLACWSIATAVARSVPSACSYISRAPLPARDATYRWLARRHPAYIPGARGRQVGALLLGWFGTLGAGHIVYRSAIPIAWARLRKPGPLDLLPNGRQLLPAMDAQLIVGVFDMKPDCAHRYRQLLGNAVERIAPVEQANHFNLTGSQAEGESQGRAVLRRGYPHILAATSKAGMQKFDQLALGVDS